MCKRNRPKFKVGDIVEEYCLNHTTNKGVVLYWLVAEVKYDMQAIRLRNRRKKHTRRLSVHIKKQKNKPKYHPEWEYHFVSLAENRDYDKNWSIECRYLDLYMSVKKIG